MAMLNVLNTTKTEAHSAADFLGLELAYGRR